MSSDFPFVIDRIALTDDWSLHLPLVCKRRMEEGQLVLWRPGFTVWLTAWGNSHDESIETRKAQLVEQAAPEKYDEREHEESGLCYYSYRLAEESSDKRAPALYGFAFSDQGHLQLSIYFDEEDDAEMAYHVLRSANGEPATLPDAGIFTQLCFVTNMIMEDGLPVSYMYREEADNADDSGWRFFSGQESQEYIDDPDNTQLYPVAFVAQSTPDIIPDLLSPAGSQLERQSGRLVRV